MRAALALLFASPALAHAEPVAQDQQEPTAALDSAPAAKSYWIPVGEAFTFNVLVNAGAQIAGRDWADISMSTVADNLTGTWGWDEDPFTINGLAHPYGGAIPFTAARSTGHGFWVSSIYAFGSSAFWELVLENEQPSINDQITTTFAGALLGESMHRIGRSLRTGNGGWTRDLAAAVIDPLGAFNGKIWRKPWRDRLKPSYYAHAGVGVARMTRTYDDVPMDEITALHFDLVMQQGLPGDRDLVLSHPLDHFDVRASADFSGDDIIGTLDIRGLIVGRRISHGFWGMYGTYDFTNPDRVRVSAIGLGPGIALERSIGRAGYVRGTGVLTAVPWGAAGGTSEEEAEARDYQRGPGLGQILEIEGGRHGIGGLRLTSRAWEIDGRLTGDSREFVTVNTLAAHLALSANHALGVEGTFSLRGSELGHLIDRTFEARAFYSLTSGHY